MNKTTSIYVNPESGCSKEMLDALTRFEFSRVFGAKSRTATDDEITQFLRDNSSEQLATSFKPEFMYPVTPKP